MRARFLPCAAKDSEEPSTNSANSSPLMAEFGPCVIARDQLDQIAFLSIDSGRRKVYVFDRGKVEFVKV